MLKIFKRAIKHENDKCIEEMSDLIKDKNFDRALYNSALLGYSYIVSGLVKSGDDMPINYNDDKKAFDYITNKKDVIWLVYVMFKKGNMGVLNKFKDFSSGAAAILI